MIRMTLPEKTRGRYVCYAYSDDPNEVIAALENLGIKRREVRSEDDQVGFQINKAEANKLEHQGAQFEGAESPPPITMVPPPVTGQVQFEGAESSSPPEQVAEQVAEQVTPQVAGEVTGEVTRWSADLPSGKTLFGATVDPHWPGFEGQAVPKVAQQVIPRVAPDHGERVHHRTSPSTLQAREACSHYEPGKVESDAARAGTRQHEAVERRSIEGLPTDEEAAAVVKCIEFTDSVEALFAARAEKEGGKYIHLNEAYVHVDDADTSAGYFDEAFIFENEAALIDYKFGQWEVEPAENNLQAFAYVLGLFRQYPAVEKCAAYFVMPYRDAIESCVFPRDQQKEMLLRIQTVVARSLAKAGQPTPSFLACYGCNNKGTCSALAGVAIKISEKFAPLKTPKEFDPMRVSDPADAVLGFQLATLMEGWAKAFKGRVTNLAVEDENFVPQGYRVISSADRIITDSRKAFQALTPVLGEDKLWEMIKLGISGVETAVMERAPKGQKSAQAQEVVEMLGAKNLLDRGETKVYLRAVTGAKDITD